jgi:hypothetical protein
LKSGKTPEKSGKILAKYGIPTIRAEKHHHVSVLIPTIPVPNFEPFLDFSDNTKTVESNVEKRTVRGGKNSVCFHLYHGRLGDGHHQLEAQG